MHDSPLDYPLKAQRGLRVDIFTSGQNRCVVINELAQLATQGVNIGSASAQHLGRRGVVQQRQQQVLYGYKFVSRGAGLYKGRMQADFKLFGNHASSITYRSG